MELVARLMKVAPKMLAAAYTLLEGWVCFEIHCRDFWKTKNNYWPKPASISS